MGYIIVKVVLFLEVQKVAGYQNIYQIDSFDSEFERNVLGRSRVENKRYVSWLLQCLHLLDEQLERAVLLSRFEKLQNAEIYSMRYPNSEKNPRVLYYFYKSGTPVLLGAFLEKSPGDYARNIRLAENRAAILSSQVLNFKEDQP